MNQTWIIDDDPIASAIARHLIGRHAHFNLSGFFDGAQTAIDKLRDDSEKKPDMIMLDLNMPVMSGWDFLDQMAAIPGAGKIPVAIFTSSIDPRDFERGSKYGVVVGHFIKPVSIELLDEINLLLSEYAQQH